MLLLALFNETGSRFSNAIRGREGDIPRGGRQHHPRISAYIFHATLVHACTRVEHPRRACSVCQCAKSCTDIPYDAGGLIESSCASV